MNQRNPYDPYDDEESYQNYDENPYTGIKDERYDRFERRGHDNQYDGAYMRASQGEEPQEEKKKKKFFFWLIFLIALSIFLYSAYQLFTIFKANWDEKRELETLTEIGNIPENPETPFTINWNALKEINDHLVAWIMIPDTNISYPIVQGSDNTYYLDHTFAKGENYAGAVFVDYHNKPDFSDNNTFIYGHNVRHGTMFADLENFMDPTFFNDHKYVYLFTPDQNYRCEVVSFQSTKDGTDAYRFGITDVKEWKKYIELITSPNIKGHVRNDVKMGESDRLISLSTCSYEVNNDVSDQRYLLHAKLVPWVGQYEKEEGVGPENP